MIRLRSTSWRHLALIALGLCASAGLALAQTPNAKPSSSDQATPVRAKRLVGLNVTEASVRPGAAGQTELLVKLSAQSKDALALFTKAHVGSEIEVVVDGQSLQRVRLVTPLIGGELVLAGPETAQALATRLSNRQATLELRVAAAN